MSNNYSGLFLVDKGKGWLDIVVGSEIAETSSEGYDVVMARYWWLLRRYPATPPKSSAYLLPLEFLNLDNKGEPTDEV